MGVIQFIGDHTLLVGILFVIITMAVKYLFYPEVPEEGEIEDE